MLRRALAGASIAAAAATFAMPAMPADAGVARTAADAWADFQTPAAWDNPKDNLHWYVESPVITSAQVGRTATVTVTTPSTLDCGSLAGGFGTAKGWRSVTLTTSSCTGTSASVSYTVTRAMVGKRVSVLGWSSVATRTATVDGRVTIGGSSRSATVTASRSDAVVPIATPTALGSYQGKQVSIASAGGINEVWVGDVRYSAPEGTVAHVSLDGGVVNLWIQGATSMDQWKLDVATGQATTQSVASVSAPVVGTPGFTVDTGETLLYGTKHVFYSWAGTEVMTYGAYDETVVGFTDTAAVLTGSYRVANITVRDVDGTTWGSATASSPGDELPITLIAPDRVEFTRSDQGVTSSCTITKAAGTTCSH